LWKEFNLGKVDVLKVGDGVNGLAIVQHPMPTLVIMPENHIELDEHKLCCYKQK
jgi:N-methylhydantoinase A/oxoprolinase/acetone carboxylase beta subunit